MGGKMQVTELYSMNHLKIYMYVCVCVYIYVFIYVVKI